MSPASPATPPRGGGTVSLETRAELLMDHHKDTSAIIHSHWKARDRLFLWLVLISALVALESVDSQPLYDGINGYLRSRFELAQKSNAATREARAATEGKGRRWEGFDFGILSLALRLALLFAAIKYYQRASLLDRQFRYLHGLEKQLCQWLGRDVVARAGKAHFSRKGAVPEEDEKGVDNRPRHMKLADGFYAYVCPYAIILLAILRLIQGDLMSSSILIAVLGVLCSVAIIAYSVAYIWWVATVGRRDRVPNW